MVKTFIPTSVEEALDILSNNDVYIFAGGSDLMVLKKNTAGLLPNFDKDILYLSQIKDLSGIYQDNEGIHVKAMTTLDEVMNNKNIPVLLRKCIAEVASINIRHFATLAGNIANASPAGDTIVCDVLLDAIIVLVSKKGVRKVKAEDFVLGIRKIDRNKDELISEIIFPNNNFENFFWHKVGSRKADSISKVSFAGAYSIKDNKIVNYAAAFGSVSIKVARSKEIEKEVIGLSVKELEANKDKIIEKYNNIISPIDDQRSNKEYRRKVAMNILDEFLNKIIKGGK